MNAPQQAKHHNPHVARLIAQAEWLESEVAKDPANRELQQRAEWARNDANIAIKHANEVF